MQLLGSVDGNLVGAALRAPVDRRAAAAQALRHRGAEEEVPAALRQGRDLRVRADRAGRRLRSRRACTTTAEPTAGRQGLHPQRREALVHQRHACRAARRDGARPEDARRSAPSSSRRTGRASRSCTAASSWACKALDNGSSASRTSSCPKENLLGGEGKGLKLALITLNTGRLTIPAGSRRRRQALPRDRRELGQRARAVGPADRQARGDRPQDRRHGRHHLRDGVDRRAWPPRWPTAAATTSASRRPWPRCGTPTAPGRSSTTRMQIRGGRGYETERSLAARGEEPIARRAHDARLPHQPASSRARREIMHLFMAREAVDKHLRSPAP